MSAILEKAIETVASCAGIAGDFLNENSLLIEDCGTDSLDLVEIGIELEEEFAIIIDDDEVERWKTIGDIVATLIAKGPFADRQPWTERMIASIPEATGTEARVIADITDRQRKGISKYGVTVEANRLSLKEWLEHAYLECLDQAVYLKRAIEEIEKS
jgi:acyl carrier protein